MTDANDLPLFGWNAALSTELASTAEAISSADETPPATDECPTAAAAPTTIAAADAIPTAALVGEDDAPAHADHRVPAMASDAANTMPPRPPSEPPVLSPEDRPAHFAGALAWVEAHCGFEPEQLRHLRSDVATAARMAGLRPDQLPCDPVLLRPILNRIIPMRFRIKAKRWSSIKSALARVLKLTGWHDTDQTLKMPLQAPWNAACDVLPESPQKAVFAHFARFCQGRGIRPDQVTEQTIETYRDWRNRRTLALDVTHGVSSLRRHWNRIVRDCPAWPQRPLQRARDPRCYALPFDSLLPSLRAEIETYCASMAVFSPLDPVHTRRYARLTIQNSRATLVRAASVLVSKGTDLNQLVHLRDILNPAALKTVLLEHAERLGGGERWAPSAVTVAITLKRAARASGALSEAELQEVGRLCGMVKPAPHGLTRTARERIAQFDEPKILRKFLGLAGDCFKTADELLNPTPSDKDPSPSPAPKKAAKLHQKALALAILINKPLRRESLARLDLATDFRRDSRGRIVGLAIPGEKTKNGRDEEAIFEPSLIKRLERHVKVYRPILCESDSTFLFPGTVDGHRCPQTMSRELARLVQDQVGAAFNVHLVRHLMVTMLLEEDPRNMPVAQRMLGHGALKTTERHYGGTRVRGAHREWESTLRRKMKQLKRRGDK